MLYLADTNILLRSVEPAHPMHTETVKAVSTLLARGETIYIVPQNIIEFWGVATRRPEDNGLGFTPAQAQAEVSRIEIFLTILEDSPAIFPEWRKLVVAYAVEGK
jgi:predicted nucleic acid-binding protein